MSMKKMKRADVLKAIEGCGINGDQQGFLRIYTENRVSYLVAITAFRKGVAMARGAQ